MVQYLMEENIIIYIFAGLGALGFITRLILDVVYNRLVRESDSMGATKNKQLKHMKLKFETCYKLKIGVNNVDTFVDKNVYKHRFCGILLSTWENFGGQVLFLSLLLVPVSAVFGVAFDGKQDKILLTGAVGILTSAILILVDKSINLSNKKAMIKLNLEDYFDNFCKVRLEQEAFHPEELEQYRKEYFQAIEAKKQISAASAPVKAEPKAELDRRREARQKKEEEKRLQALKRAEEQKRLEEIRKEEEKRRMEERKQLAAKRQEEELRKLEEERAALEARKAEAKRKAEERQLANQRKHRKGEEKEPVLHSREEEILPVIEEVDKDPVIMIQGVEEMMDEKESHGKDKPQQKAAEMKKKGRSISVQEEKLVEDILKEFFA